MTVLPLYSLPELAEMLGPMPAGDTPAAWWVSTDPDVLAGYDLYAADRKSWFRRWNQLLGISGFPSDSAAKTAESNTLIGVMPPAGATVSSRWWRRASHTAYYVPRKRTREEKASEVNGLFAQLIDIPVAIDYLPGIPSSLWAKVQMGEHDYRREGYPVTARRPAQAVCAFVGVDPVVADPAFEVSEAWLSMKVSTFLQLRERQAAEGLII